MNYFLLFFDHTGRPQVLGPFPDAQTRDTVAQLQHRDNGGDSLDYLKLDIQNNIPEISLYADSDLVLGLNEWTENGLLMPDGSVIFYPEQETGAIVHYMAGEIVGEWWPGDPDYDKVMKRFPLHKRPSDTDEPKFTVIF